MKKYIKKLLAITIVATPLLGSTITACAYDLPKAEQLRTRKYAINDLYP